MVTIDATNEKLGRIASKVAKLLIGKDKTDFVKNSIVGSKVKVINASKMNILEKKMKTKTHSRYSGYPGGLTKETLDKTVSKKGYGEILKLAVSGMLPKNRLRTKFLLNLEVTE
jgi:large subunit ribosomal protein L13